MRLPVPSCSRSMISGQNLTGAVGLYWLLKLMCRHLQNTEQQVVFDLDSFALGSLTAQVQWLLDNIERTEGMSLLKSTPYNHYLRHCNENNLDPGVTVPSFDKLIRSVFVGLRATRLGTRLVFFRIRIRVWVRIRVMD